TVQECVDHLVRRYGASVESRTIREEHVSFPLPRELRLISAGTRCGGEAMATLLKIGPADHDRPITLDEFRHAEYEEGYQYEIIDGRLYVSPQPNAPGGIVEWWITLKLALYAMQHPEVINYVHPKARVYVPDRPDLTIPEPDATAFRAFP